MIEKVITFEETSEKFKKQIEETKKCFERYRQAKDNFESLEFDELMTCDFKELYGANNDKIRKEHVKRKFDYEYNRMKLLENELLTNERLCDFYKLKLEAQIKVIK